MAYRFMQANQGGYAIREMAGFFGVSSGAYYQWAKNGVSERRNTELIRLIRKTQHKHHNRYGSPVREVLRRDYGERVSLKKVTRLMRENDCNSQDKT
jgi:hypothetical protein